MTVISTHQRERSRGQKQCSWYFAPSCNEFVYLETVFCQNILWKHIIMAIFWQFAQPETVFCQKVLWKYIILAMFWQFALADLKKRRFLLNYSKTKSKIKNPASRCTSLGENTSVRQISCLWVPFSYAEIDPQTDKQTNILFAVYISIDKYY